MRVGYELITNEAHAVLDELGVMLKKCSPALNGFWQTQEGAVVNACLVLIILLNVLNDKSVIQAPA